MPNLGNDKKLPYDEVRKDVPIAASIAAFGAKLKPSQYGIAEITAGAIRLIAKKADGTVVSIALA